MDASSLRHQVYIQVHQYTIDPYRKPLKPCILYEWKTSHVVKGPLMTPPLTHVYVLHGGTQVTDGTKVYIDSGFTRIRVCQALDTVPNHGYTLTILFNVYQFGGITCRLTMRNIVKELIPFAKLYIFPKDNR